MTDLFQSKCQIYRDGRRLKQVYDTAAGLEFLKHEEDGQYQLEAYATKCIIAVRSGVLYPLNGMLMGGVFPERTVEEALEFFGSKTRGDQ